MRVAVMQPYFLPYLGYYQLIGAVDNFVVYDTIEYTKKGWINRNRFLRNAEATTFTLPLAKASDYLDVVERQISDEFRPSKLCAQIAGAYRKAPEFESAMPVIEDIVHHSDRNLFGYIRNALVETCAYLGISTPLLTASDVEGGRPQLSHAARVINICEQLDGEVYVNPPGGRELYKQEDFAAAGLELRFLEPRLSAYDQFGQKFVPGLSILDVMMFNSAAEIRDHLLKDFTLAE